MSELDVLRDHAQASPSGRRPAPASAAFSGRLVAVDQPAVRHRVVQRPARLRGVTGRHQQRLDAGGRQLAAAATLPDRPGPAPPRPGSTAPTARRAGPPARGALPVVDDLEHRAAVGRPAARGDARPRPVRCHVDGERHRVQRVRLGVGHRRPRLGVDDLLAEVVDPLAQHLGAEHVLRVGLQRRADRVDTDRVGPATGWPRPTPPRRPARSPSPRTTRTVPASTTGPPGLPAPGRGGG